MANLKDSFLLSGGPVDVTAVVLAQGSVSESFTRWGTMEDVTQAWMDALRTLPGQPAWGAQLQIPGHGLTLGAEGLEAGWLRAKLDSDPAVWEAVLLDPLSGKILAPAQAQEGHLLYCLPAQSLNAVREALKQSGRLPDFLTTRLLATVGGMRQTRPGSLGNASCLVMEVGVTSSQITLLHPEGLISAGEIPAGWDSLFASIQERLQLRFAGSASRLFLTGDYDFHDIAGDLAGVFQGPITELLAPYEGTIPAVSYLHVYPWPENKRYLVEELAHGLRLTLLPVDGESLSSAAGWEAPVEAPTLALPGGGDFRADGIWTPNFAQPRPLTQLMEAFAAAQAEKARQAAEAARKVVAKPAPAPAPAAPVAAAASPAPQKAAPAKAQGKGKAASKAQKPAAAPAPASAPAAPAPAPAPVATAAPRPAAPAAKKKPPFALIGGIAAALVAGVIGFVVFSGGSDPAPVTKAPVAASPAPKPTPAPAPVAPAPVPEPEPVEAPAPVAEEVAFEFANEPLPPLEEPAPVAPPPVEVEEEPAFGSVSIVSSPSGARVILNGQEVGTTPFSRVGMPAGDYNLRLEMPYYHVAEKTFRIEDGSLVEHRERLNLISGDASFTANASDAEVTVRSVGLEDPTAPRFVKKQKVPSTFARLRPGRYEAVYSRPGWPEYTQPFTVTEDAQLNLAWEYQTATLHLRTEPEGAMVYQGTRPLGRTPLTLDALAAGAHEMELFFSDEYERERVSVTLDPGGEQVLDLPLRRWDRIVAPHDIEVYPVASPANSIGAVPENLRKYKGKVTVVAVVELNGTLSNIEVRDTKDPVLVRFLTEQVEKWKVDPARRKGRAVRMKIGIPILFGDSAQIQNLDLQNRD